MPLQQLAGMKQNWPSAVHMPLLDELLPTKPLLDETLLPTKPLLDETLLPTNPLLVDVDDVVLDDVLDAATPPVPPAPPDDPLLVLVLVLPLLDVLVTPVPAGAPPCPVEAPPVEDPPPKRLSPAVPPHDAVDPAPAASARTSASGPADRGVRMVPSEIATGTRAHGKRFLVARKPRTDPRARVDRGGRARTLLGPKEGA